MDAQHFVLNDESHDWYQMLLENQLEAARRAVQLQYASTIQDENGCWVTPTVGPRKLRFAGRQERAYRFVFAVHNHTAPSTDEVVRHRCNNRRCINPELLELGSKLDNFHDDLAFRANGVDFALL